jgi:hypothetical protein
MTDYNQFYNDDGSLITSAHDPSPPLSCSKNKNMSQFIKHLKELRHLTKLAADDGFCLDELIDAVKELEK